MTAAEPLTAAMIRSEPVGPRMDDWVAELVMGWRQGDYGVNAGMWVDGSGREAAWKTDCCQSSRWSPSTSIAAAMGVLCKARDGHFFAITGEGADYCCKLMGPGDRIIGRGDTISLAICRAALLKSLEAK